MRKNLLLLALLSVGFLSYSQSTYEVTTIGQNYTLSQINNAIESSDFCGYYYNDERHLLLFDDGTEVELKSDEELQLEGVNLSSPCVTTDRKENPVVWAIGTNGKILRGGPSTGNLSGSNE